MPARKKQRRFNPRFLLLCLLLLLGGAAAVRFALPALPGEDIPTPRYVDKDYLTVNQWSRPGTELKSVRGVVIHYVGNPGTSAAANRDYFESLKHGEGTYASSHFIVGLKGEVVQCVPLTEQAYASNARNEDTVSVEVCHPDETGQFSPDTYDRVVELTAWLCETFRLDPEEDVIRHYDVSGKICPKYYVEHSDAWDALRADIAAAMAEE